ncbi:654_t:CDS:2, partial [Ambispora leptoticha]
LPPVNPFQPFPNPGAIHPNRISNTRLGGPSQGHIMGYETRKENLAH